MKTRDLTFTTQTNEEALSLSKGLPTWNKATINKVTSVAGLKKEVILRILLAEILKLNPSSPPFRRPLKVTDHL